MGSVVRDGMQREEQRNAVEVALVVEAASALASRGLADAFTIGLFARYKHAKRNGTWSSLP